MLFSYNWENKCSLSVHNHKSIIVFMAFSQNVFVPDWKLLNHAAKSVFTQQVTGCSEDPYLPRSHVEANNVSFLENSTHKHISLSNLDSLKELMNLSLSEALVKFFLHSHPLKDFIWIVNRYCKRFILHSSFCVLRLISIYIPQAIQIALTCQFRWNWKASQASKM